MKKIYQRTDSDCQKCALAVLLDKEYEEIPDFAEGIDMNIIMKEQADIFDARLDKYLEENGMFRVDCKVSYTDELLIIPYVSKTQLAIGILRKNERKYSHAVVIEVSFNRCSIVFDPKKNSDYDLKDITYIEFICKEL